MARVMAIILTIVIAIALTNTKINIFSEHWNR